MAGASRILTDLAYRDATPADAPRLAQLAARAFTETFGHLYDSKDLALFLERHTPAKWEALLRQPDSRVRLVEADHDPVAYVLVEPTHLPFAPERPALEIGQFYVLAPWHGAGIAPELMRWAIAAARAGGAAELYLSVFVDNHRARRFYARHGFEVVGRHAFMVGTHQDEDLIMRLTL